MFTNLPNPVLNPYEINTTNNLNTLSIGGGRNSMRVDKRWLSLWAENWENAMFRVDMDGNTKMNNADIRGTISGRSTDMIARVISNNGEVITKKLNTETGEILKDFSFAGYEWAFKSGDIEWNKTNGKITSGSGVLMMSEWIIWAKNGDAKFVLKNNGDAIFGGTLKAPNGELGTITAGNISGVTIVGSTLKTAETGERVVLNRQNMISYGSDGKTKFQTSSRWIRLLDGNVASDIYVSWTTTAYGNVMPIVKIKWKVDGDVIQANKVEWFSGDFTNLNVGGQNIINLIQNNRNDYVPPSNMLKLYRYTDWAVILETQWWQRITIYAQVGG